MGGVAAALLSAASQSPGTVVQLAQRSCVGYGAARYTASRLVSAGALAPLAPGRPAVLAPPGPQQRQEAPPARPQGADLERALRSFWEVTST